MKHIWGFISRLERVRPSSAGHSIPLQPPYHASAPFIPSLYLRVVHTKSEVASSSSKSSRRQAGGRTDFPFLSLSPCFIVSLRAINSRGFTFPWKSAKHPPANIIHGTRPLFLRVTFPICGEFCCIADDRIQRPKSSRGNRCRSSWLRNSLIPPCEVRRNAEYDCHLSHFFSFVSFSTRGGCPMSERRFYSSRSSSRDSILPCNELLWKA